MYRSWKGSEHIRLQARISLDFCASCLTRLLVHPVAFWVLASDFLDALQNVRCCFLFNCDFVSTKTQMIYLISCLEVN
jgi:hypothetical protein